MNILQRYQAVLQQFPSAERREAQERMITRVAEALETQTSAVIEAGTGAGKSFGYLIPALLQQKRPIVISTATIALQEQLIHKDIPTIIGALKATREDGSDLVVKLVKGRGNYLCVQKLLEFERQLKPSSADFMYLNYLKSEWQEDWDGDLGSLDLTVPYQVWNEVRSDAEDCLGRRCQFFRDNPYRVAREDLDQADIIVSNHALYLQDLVAGKTLLPPHDVVIFDEAHQLKAYALNALTVRIGKFATTKLLQKIQRRLQPIPEDVIRTIADSESAMMEWLFRNKQETFRLNPDPYFMALIDRHIHILDELLQWLGGVDVKQLSIVETDLDADRVQVQKNNLLNQLQGLTGRWQYFLIADHFEAQRVNWAELDFKRLFFELKSTPLNVSDLLLERLWGEKTAILTSATMSVGGHSERALQYFKQDLGIEQASADILPSPFHYESQCLLYLPKPMPEPNLPTFNIIAAEEIEAILKLTQGRALVLFTSNAAMKMISDALIPQLPFPCKVQGELPRQRLIDWFKETRNSVIFATATFWEGIDIPGEALSCVIMDKIPFAAPNDPVNQAMVDYLKLQGRDWFSDYVLPQAILKLKQGFGRLIRTKTDTGIVAILDPRITGKGYGKVIQRSLPKVTVLHTRQDLTQVWENLNAKRKPKLVASVDESAS